MSSTGDQPSEQFLTMLGVGSGVMQIVVFTAVGVMTLDSVPYGVAIGGLSGLGTFLFLPWFLSLSAAQEEDDDGFGPAMERISRDTGPGVFGLGLEMGAIVMLAVGFARGPDLLLGVAIALAVAVGVYLVGSFVLGRQS
ncbi:hypothetical protein B4589_000875 [Halolamina sp. CBA1230]|uniref:hypothetical protein n=1 Tax=Halolamina sp. CBA1230 TaxID=1853690 RepID=UPI0009A22D9D|nr:hypothetical protein [Halolamina sp. CBA1230]QKY18995.1 hypothetical protein B4589_000875 [Halolamina sp. CBA1230]